MRGPSHNIVAATYKRLPGAIRSAMWISIL